MVGIEGVGVRLGAPGHCRSLMSAEATAFVAAYVDAAQSIRELIETPKVQSFFALLAYDQVMRTEAAADPGPVRP